MSGAIFLALTAAFCVALFVNGLWWSRRTTMPFADRPRWWVHSKLVAVQLKHMQAVARIHMIMAPVVFLVVTAIVLNHTFKFVPE